MSAIIACTAGRDALLAMPTRNATPAIATGWCMNPRSATDTAVEACAISSVGRRPSRSVITPPPSEEITPPSPCRAATRPAYVAE
jgi:hypothetical protein